MYWYMYMVNVYIIIYIDMYMLPVHEIFAV